MILMTTSLGDITLELYPDKAPVSVANFLSYVDAGFYDGTLFHRVIPEFMIQGGGFTHDMRQKKTRTPIQSEADNGLSNTRYAIAMARTADIHSATSQFFINVADNSFLNHGARDHGYAVFGKVALGTDVVDKISRVRTRKTGIHENMPVETVMIAGMTRIE